MIKKIKEFLHHFEITVELSPTIWGVGFISTSHYPRKSGHISIHVLPLIITLHVCTKCERDLCH